MNESRGVKKKKKAKQSWNAGSHKARGKLQEKEKENQFFVWFPFSGTQ